MSPLKIAFFDAKPYDEETFVKTNRDFGYEFKFYKERLSPDTAGMANGFDAVCPFVNDQVNAKTIERLVAGGTKLLAMRCAGYNNVDLVAAYGKLHVVRVPAYSPHAVAEHAVALLLCLNRKIHRAYYRVRDNNFSIIGFTGFDLFGKTAGVIGTGKIGMVLVRILIGFGMRVLAFDPYPNRSAEKELGFSYADTATLFRESDVISLHCPLTKETDHLIRKETLDQMKDGVFLINTGRGRLIQTRDLIEALKSGKVGGAGLDVYEEESEIFFEDFSGSFLDDDVLARLLSFPNVLVTSHQGFLTREALANISHTTLESARDFFNDQPLKNEICYHCGKSECERKKKGRCF